MKQLARKILIIIGIIILIPFWSEAGKDTLLSARPMAQPEQNETNALPSTVMPFYQAPKGAIPGGRLKELGRSGKYFPVIQVLAPNHIGMTRHKQPTLYWYLSDLTTYSIEFTLVDSRTISPVVETVLARPTEAGVQQIRLRDYGINLDVDVPYRWF